MPDDGGKYCYKDCWVKQSLEVRLDEMDKRYDIIQKHHQESLTLAKTEVDRRLTDMNFIREQMKDREDTLQSKEIYRVEVGGLLERMAQSEKWRATHDGLSSRSQLYSLLALIVSMVAVLVHFLK